MDDQVRSSNGSPEELSPSDSSLTDQCKRLVSIISNKTTGINDLSSIRSYVEKVLIKENLTKDAFKSVPECVNALTRYMNNTNDSNTTLKTKEPIFRLSEYSLSLIVFVILIGCVSLISILGNLCLAKVLYSKRFRLIQTDRIVLCLALSELCLVLIDTPTEIYRFLSYSFTQEWLCRFHTFFEALFSSCIIFYHLLGAFDRFVYIHGHVSTNGSSWSRWCRRISTKSCSIILLLLPLICSLPIAICNCLHANVLQTTSTNKTCIVQYTHGLLISLLISFYILPLLFSFFLHGKLVYFIRTRHNQHYLTTTAYILPMKRNNTTEESHSKRRTNKGHLNNPHDRLSIQTKHLSHRHLLTTNTDTLGSTTTTTMGTRHSAPLNPNNSSNSSQSSRSSTGTTSTTTPIVLYKINSQANANANRTVLLLVLLLSFYVFCWAPYNVYTWIHAYQLTQTTNQPINHILSLNDSNQTSGYSLTNNLNADLRRIIYINYSLYLLSMISMCFSFIFYFALNKQARHEFSRFIGCICPWIIRVRSKKHRKNYPKQTRQLQYRARFQHQYPYKNDRVKQAPPSLLNDRYPHAKYLHNDTSKRTVLNYGCQIQCCP